MSIDSNLPEALEDFRSIPLSAFRLGIGIAQLLLHIPQLVWGHLDHPINFNNPISDKLRFAPAFVSAVDHLIVKMRRRDGTLNALPNWQTSDRKERRRQIRYVKRMSATVEAAFKYCVLEVFEDKFLGWSVKETQCFNKGMVDVLSEIDWRIMPDTNVLVEAKDGDWAKWLREQCSELEMICGKNLYRDWPVRHN